MRCVENPRLSYRPSAPLTFSLSTSSPAVWQSSAAAVCSAAMITALDSPRPRAAGTTPIWPK